ncbi:hypothetical protein NP493_1257g00026 [Ridgeia piscesae]|uniref:SEA domain-containing protein n=1 Tax=Ridgeia piscesae TaxID=27915 RepID=A0AAD9KBP7_RIDPI|nr:hypothetical protein NP493_1257g00026 [Ridgeia piscesae]
MVAQSGGLSRQLKMTSSGGHVTSNCLLLLLVSVVVAAAKAETEDVATTESNNIMAASQTRVVIQHASQALVNLNFRLTSETYSQDLADKTSIAYASLKAEVVNTLADVLGGQLKDLLHRYRRELRVSYLDLYVHVDLVFQVGGNAFESL